MKLGLFSTATQDTLRLSARVHDADAGDSEITALQCSHNQQGATEEMLAMLFNEITLLQS